MGFLAGELTGLGVKCRGKRLVTTPEEIAEHTGLDVGAVKKWLLRTTGMGVEGKVVVIRVGRTDVIVRLVD